MTATDELPFSPQVEQAVLGLCLVNNKAIDLVAADADEHIFYETVHRALWTFILHLASEGIVTPLIVYSAMKTNEALAELGGLNYLVTLAEAAPALSDTPSLVRVLRDLAVRRDLITIGEDLVNDAYEAPKDQPSRITIGRATERLLSIGDLTARRLSKIGDVAAASIGRLETRLNNPAAAEGITTGLYKMDKALGRMLRGDRIGIAARSGLGKSALAGGICLSAALSGAPVLVMSADMLEQKWAERTICDMDRRLRPWEPPLHYQRFRTGQVSESDWERFVLAQQALEGLPMHIDDTPAISVASVRGRARALAQAYPGRQGVLCVDFFQKMEDQPGADRRRDEFLTSVAYQLGDIARDIGWSLLLLVQMLNKETDAKGQLREDPPSVAAIRETGGLEMALDIIMSPFRKAFFIERRHDDISSKSLALAEPCKAGWSVRNHMQILGWKLRDGNAMDLDMDLWCDMGSNAVRDEAPTKRSAADQAAEQAADQLAMTV